jgi:diguanylate cyclase (GGDEF)-like protein
VVALFVLAVGLAWSPDAWGAQKKSVLILNSYHPGYTWTDDETRGVIEALAPLQEELDISIEYMGAKWANDRAYFELLRKTYREKYRKRRFDAILATDNDAIAFLKEHRDAAFGSVPVVFCGVNWFEEKSLRGLKHYTGVNEDVDITATLDLMLKLHPTTKTIFVIADTTTTGRIVREKLLEIAPRYRERVRFSVPGTVTMRSVLDTVAKAPEDSLVLLTVFQEDREGAFFEPRESTSLIAKASVVPVYGLWDFNLGHGIVGGLLTSGYAQGHAAGVLALRILRGEHASTIPVVLKSPNVYMFDYRELARFNISIAELPPSSRIVKQPESFYQLNKQLVRGALAAIALLASVVVLLALNIRSRRKTAAILRGEIEERMRAEEALRAIQDGLEKRVQERTADLASANQQLLDEISVRKRVEERLRELSERDPLTKIYNRRKVMEFIAYEVKKAKRHQRPLSLLLLDVDRFKRINDAFGHTMGDLVLITIADLIGHLMRGTDIFARYGGEEFIVVTPETSLAGAAALAEKIRLAIEQHTYPQIGTVTISIGAACFEPGEDEAALIKRADAALYAAKNNGRNRVEIAGPGLKPLGAA